ncbi:MAG: DinB family protein [Anaerolineales bacterium]|nr:DinB family protein [Anaerolineales bacterium]MCB8954513.1 DinB family protein [Ardenticatenales bacterium]
MTHPKKEIVLERLASTRHALFELLQSLDEAAWQTQVYADGDRWTVLDLLRHVSVSEKSMTLLMENIRRGGEGASAEFDLNRWNASQVRKQQEKTPAHLLADMEANRRDLLTFVDSLSADDWEKQGRHGSGRVMSIYEIVKLIGLHEKTHLTDIQATVG